MVAIRTKRLCSNYNGGSARTAHGSYKDRWPFLSRTWGEAVEQDLPLDNERRTEDFMELYASCEHRLYTYIVMLIGDPVDARDILQDTALILWQKYDQFDRSKPFFAWAHEF